MKKLYFFFLALIFGVISFSQANICDTITPTFNANLSSSPSATFVSSPPVQRLGNCCGTTRPDKCVQFILTLHPDAIGINFVIASGAVASGAMFYQIGCGPQIPVGDPICLNGVGPHILTFCKPGNNLNTYAITSIPTPYVSSPDTVVEGCFTPLQVNGVVIDSSISWTSISPGAPGTYNNLLDCTVGCRIANFTPDTNTPSFVDYLVCGTPAAPCLANTQFCDTIRVDVLPQLQITAPSPVTYCSLSGGIQLNGAVTGGSPPYVMSWTDPNGNQIGNSSSIYATSPGTYTFSATDNSFALCPIAKSVAVQVIQSVPAIVSAGSDLSICSNNPTVTLNGTIINGTTVQWIGGTGVFNPDRTSLNPTYTMSAAEIAAGNVSLILTSTGDTVCPGSSSTVNLTIAPPLVVNIIAPTNICFGTRAYLSASISGGTPPYSIIWNSGETTSSIGPKFPGTYIVTVTDNSANTCITSDTALIVEDPPLLVNVPNSLVSCDTTVTLNAIVSGGRPGYNYLWSTFQTTSSIQANTGTYFVTVTDSTGCSSSDSSNVTASNSLILANIPTPPLVCIGDSAYMKVNVSGDFGGYTAIWSTGQSGDSVLLSKGSYCVTITDSIGCIATACSDIVNDSIILDVTPIDVNCFGGSNGAVHTTVTSGVAPFSFQWSGNGNTDTTSLTANLGAGNYFVTITDNLGCQLTKPVTINQPTQITVNTSNTITTCYGVCDGSASASASGGVPPYNYYWPLVSVSGTSISNLCAQPYSVIVTDLNGCSNVGSATITEPPNISASFNSVPANCGKSDGSLSINASGGNPGYSYFWTPGGQTTPVITALLPATYCVSVTDANNCVNSFCSNIINLPGVNSNVSNSVPITCLGRCDGSINTFSSGGRPPYNYMWSNMSSSQNLQNLCTGIYTLLTVDANGCQDTTTGYVGYPSPVTVTAIVPGLACDTGITAIAFGSGGNGGPYTFYWLPDSVFSDSLNVLPSNSPYIVKAFDIAGCESDTTLVPVEGYLPITSGLSLQPNDSICLGDPSYLYATAMGGNPSYQYNWTPSGATGQNVIIYPTATGYQYVTISDLCGTAKKDSLLITVVQPPPIDPQSDTYFGCAPLCVNLFNSNAIYPSCHWNFGDGETSDSCFASHCYMTPGQYYPVLTVTNEFGCTNSDSTSFFIDVIDNPYANFTISDWEQDMFIHKDITFTDISVYTGINEWYFILEGDTLFNFYNVFDPVVNFQVSGEYTVVLIIVNSNGCPDTTSKKLLIKDLEFIYVPNTFTPNGNGDNEFFSPSIVGLFDYNTYKLEIFNRWGQLIFSTNRYGDDWNGTYKGRMSKEDTYVWKLEIRMLYEDKKESFIGHVNLLK